MAGWRRVRGEPVRWEKEEEERRFWGVGTGQVGDATHLFGYENCHRAELGQGLPIPNPSRCYRSPSMHFLFPII